MSDFIHEVKKTFLYGKSELVLLEQYCDEEFYSVSLSILIPLLRHNFEAKYQI